MPGGSAIDIECDIATQTHGLYEKLILIVDDDNDVLELAAEILRTSGFDVLTARNGLEAATMLRSNSRISILFTDIQMPGMGGEELAEIALALREGIRVIFTSGCSRPHSVGPFLQKPYKAADLVGLFSPQPVLLTSQSSDWSR